MGCSGRVRGRLSLASMVQVEEHETLQELGECWDHKTMWNNFLITVSCLRVLYQSSLQGQSSGPSELLGFGSCDVERLLSCAREHTPGALLWAGKDGSPSQLPEGSDRSTCSSHGDSRDRDCSSENFILLQMHTSTSGTPEELTCPQAGDHSTLKACFLFKTSFNGSLKLPLVSGHLLIFFFFPSARAGLKKSNSLASFKGKREELESGS